MTYVCVTGNEQSPGALQQRLERVLASHPRVLCELRLDFLDLTPAAAFGFLARLPVDMTTRLILTQRLKASGPVANGQCGWDVLTWQSWWQDVMAFRPWYGVDLDWLVLDSLTGESLIWQGGKFRARHAFFSLHGTISEIETMLPHIMATAKEHQSGVKLAAPVEGAADLARLANVAAKLKELPFHVAVAMGEAGRAWRWSSLAGNVTYFAAEGGRGTAAGQEPFSAVLPYLSSTRRPDLYLLLGDNPDNKHGEERWNRAFLRRGARQRYVNTFSLDRPGPEWAANTEHWLTAAGVSGASVTKPYKLSFPEPTNTLKNAGGHWERANFDGAAVVEILRRHSLPEGAAVVIAGGGGAAQAVAAGLRENGFEPRLWVRQPDGRLAARPEGEAFVSTWPGEYQEALVDALGPDTRFRLVIDAQFSRPPALAPLALWAEARKIAYVPGTVWWREQARFQDEFWFGADRLGTAREAVLKHVPFSKSETLRALAISLAFGVPAEIRNPGISDDTEVFAAAIESLGGSVDRTVDAWRVFPPSGLRCPQAPVTMGEGATGLRILAALAPLFEGGLTIDAAPSLRARPMGEVYEGLGLSPTDSWPMVLAPGSRLPEAVSLERSSQFASGFLIAGAAQVFRGQRESYHLRFTGERRSETYLRLTLDFLRETGLEISETENAVEIRPGKKPARFHFTVERDASAIALLEAYARRWRLRTFFDGHSRQGDAEFPRLLAEALETGSVSLRHHPDLAPALWVSAALLHRPLTIRDCPQLHLKESDRAKLLVQAAQALGAKAEDRPDGFVVDFSHFVPAQQEIFLRTDGDHRLAMAFGILATDYPQIAPDRRDCVRKSFPQFWQALAQLEEALPG